MELKPTQRINRLRERLVEAEPIICAQRALLWTESYKETEDQPPLMRAALALKKTLNEMSITIYDDELLVGNQGSALRAAPLHPQINLWFMEELDAFDKRQGSRFLISEETKKKLRENMDYWKGKNVYERTMALLPQEAIDSAEAGVFTCAYTLTKGTGHFLINIEKVLTKGFNGIKAECEEYLKECDYANPEDFDKITVYKAIIVVCEAVESFALRYAARAEEMAASETDPKRKAELLTISENCKVVPMNPPKNFYQALQSTWFKQLIAQIESDGTGLSLGRLDYFLYPYYERDVQAGNLTREVAEELMDSFWLKCGEIIEVWNEEDSKSFGGHPISQAITLGGTHADGSDSTNELTYISLDTTMKVRLAQPSICVRVHKHSPDEYLLKCGEVIRYGLGMPAVYNDEIAIPSLMLRGVTLEHARRNFGVAGCVEMGVQGQMCHFANSGYFNLVRCLEVTLNDGVDPDTGKQVGPKTGKAEDFKSYEEFETAYMKQMEYALHQMVVTTNIVNTMHARWVTLPYMTATTDDCIARGKEVHDGGAIYNHDGPQAVGLADTTDSFANIKKLIFEEKRFTMKDLKSALDADFVGHEDLRIDLIKQVPKYGNNHHETDEIARHLASDFCNMVSRYRNLRGGVFVPGMYSVSANVPLGQICGASPNGRKSRQPIAEACTPSHGSERNGPTQSLLSVAKLDHLLVTNGTQYNQKYHPKTLEGEKGIRSLVDLIKTYFESGGYHIQFNVISAETMRAAQKNPRKYRDLVVRVAGYTAFFTDLNKDIQDDIIGRTEMSFVE